MARNPKVINNAENHLIVQSLEVIKDVKGGGIQTIKAKVDSLGNAMSSVSQKQEAFWKNISSDKLITAVEKKQLKKEWETINKTYNAIYEKALSLGFENEEEIRNYKENFYILKDYLFTSLKVFDNMKSNTNIPNKDYFNQLYADYYASEFLAQNRIFVGQMADTERLRVLSSLSVPGMDGEIALYKGAFYQYSFTKKEWTLIDTAAIYKGPLANFPDDVDSSFFLAITTFDYRAYLLDSSGKKIKVNDGYLVATLGEIEEGYIYAHIGGRWQKIENRNDWRYVVALNDLIHYGFEIPENINGYVAGRINDFWSGVSSDNVITSIEKKSLHKEWENLKKNYESVKTKVAGLKDSVYYNNFVTAYTELDTYLNTTLKVFVDLSADTEIPNRDIFNSKFATYYTNLTMIEFVYGETFANSKFDKLETEIANKRDPKYLGAVSDIKVISSPKKGDKYITATSIFEYSGLVWIETNFVSGDWFMWGGSNSYATFAGLEMKNGYLYKKMSETEWTELQPNTTDSNGNLIYSAEFMSALTDILNSKNAGLGYFSSVFANALFANAAFIGALQTNNITLQAKNNGQTTYIQSSNYEERSAGFRISSDGNVDFSGNFYVGGSATIGNNTSILGDAWFLGKIDSGPLYLSDEDPSSEEFQEVLTGYNTLDLFNWIEARGHNLAMGSAQSGTVVGYVPEAFNGTVGGVPFSKIFWHAGTTASYGYFYFTNKKGEKVTGIYKCDDWYEEYASLPEIIINYYTPGGRTFRLRNLPTTRGGSAGVVYQDSEGYLKITQ